MGVLLPFLFFLNLYEQDLSYIDYNLTFIFSIFFVINLEKEN